VKSYVVLAGNIGAGKSTLVKLLSDRLGWEPYYEPVAENPYLDDFYRDMKAWAFHSQVFFLTYRVRAHTELMASAGAVVQDRSFYEDAQVFARSLHRQGIMSDRDWQSYQGLYRALSGLLTPPNLVVYLRAPVATLQERIALRGRTFEANIADSYLAGLNELYEEWIAEFALAPVLVVPADRMDFVKDAEGLDAIVATVLDRLRGGQRELFAEER